MADSCFQDHGFHLEEQVEIDQPRLQERQRKHGARMHGASSACPEPIICELFLLFRPVCPEADTP